MTTHTLTLLLTFTLTVACARPTTAPVTTPVTDTEDPEQVHEIGIVGSVRHPDVLLDEVVAPLSWDGEVRFTLPAGVQLKKASGSGTFAYKWHDPIERSALLVTSTLTGHDPASTIAKDIIESMGIHLSAPLQDGEPVVCLKSTHGHRWRLQNEGGELTLLLFERRDSTTVVVLIGPAGSKAAPGGSVYEALQRMRVRSILGDAESAPVEPCAAAASRQTS